MNPYSLAASPDLQDCALRALRDAESRTRRNQTASDEPKCNGMIRRAQFSAQRRSREGRPPKQLTFVRNAWLNKGCRLVRISDTQLPGGGVVEMGRESRECSLARQELRRETRSAAGAQLEAAKSGKRSNKRKATSEDDKEPSETSAITSANSLPRFSKRTTVDQAQNLLGIKQVDKKRSRKLKTNKQHYEEISRSRLTTSRPPSAIGKRRTELLSGRRKREERIINTRTKLIRAYKRLRRASVSTANGGPGEGSEPTPAVSAKWSTVQGSVDIGPAKIREGIIVEPKVPRERTRRESEHPLSWKHSNEPKPYVEDWTEDEESDPEEYDCEDEINVAPAISVSTPKPSVPARPRIWAYSRQEVCESLDYFRSYHGGVYSKNDIVKGYLLGAHAAIRDIFHHGGKLIISHGGGKSGSVYYVRKGVKRYLTDQDQEASDKSVRALLKAHRDRRPIVLLVDDRYAPFPYDLTTPKYTYVVLGLYWISHAWAERQVARDGTGHIVRWKFAFQWCEGQDDPWWLPPKKMRLSSNSGTRLANTDGEPSIQCEGCQEHSPFIYKQGWMCLKPHCPLFWRINNREPEKKLDYRKEFLTLLPQEFDRLPNIMPAKVAKRSKGITTTYASTRGWHCQECGRLSCRYKWEEWECSNCHFKQKVHSEIRSPKDFWHLHPTKEFMHSDIAKNSGIIAHRPELVSLGGNKPFTHSLTFVLPQNRGKIHLILGTPLTNGDANSIFQLYQQQASTGELELRRFALQAHRGIPICRVPRQELIVFLARNELLANYFSQNSGEPYKYIGGSKNTTSFDKAPKCVQQALALIKERSQLALGINIPFNEILTVAYMERQKMAFHSDSEKGLGPVVASLSLGSPALMHFRPLANMGDPKSNSPYALSLILRHGDILVMDGYGIQKYYEHTVLPMNFRIAATARCIGTD